MLPNIYTSTTNPPTPAVVFLAKNLQNPQVHEFDLVYQQEVGKGTVFSASYLGSLGRQLPNYLDVNMDPTTTVTIPITVSDVANKGPLPNGAVYQVKTYTKYGNASLFGTAGTSYQGITEVISNVNSSYNALVAEVQNRSLHSLQFDFNYTWAHALDYAQNATTSLSGTTEGWLDPYANASSNYGNSNYNIPDRFVAYVLYDVPGIHGNSILKYFTNGWNIDDSFQAGSGLPYSAALNSSFNSSSAILQGWYGDGFTSFVPVIGRNTYKSPRQIADDVRIDKKIPITERYNVELMLNVFNIANHQNIDGLATTAYKLSGTTAGTLTFQDSAVGATNFGTPTSSNNSGFLFTPRRSGDRSEVQLLTVHSLGPRAVASAAALFFLGVNCGAERGADWGAGFPIWEKSVSLRLLPTGVLRCAEMAFWCAECGCVGSPCSSLVEAGRQVKRVGISLLLSWFGGRVKVGRPAQAGCTPDLFVGPWILERGSMGIGHGCDWMGWNAAVRAWLVWLICGLGAGLGRSRRRMERLAAGC